MWASYKLLTYKNQCHEYQGRSFLVWYGLRIGKKEFLRKECLQLYIF